MSAPVLRARASSDDFNQNPYGYVPTEWICILFLVLFSLSTGALPLFRETVSAKFNAHPARTALHSVETLHTRLWWLIPTACTAGALEILGWVGRLWSSLNVDAENPYLMQYVLAPSGKCTTCLFCLIEAMRQLDTLRRAVSYMSHLSRLFLI
ncbi:uncharacterized protein C8Q71DRAFT_791987 [Rhodofomes roseus]|uniref:Uncharacterized protein n=1 Tax=Rhodofomes roseus TaxID=34475 RepID=A0ABQ8JZ97_9APHY|nr:uncharacterized protein C8Q71DRAFT_791987 [Rhodofomes roseus]KAH9829050.1 hypothetical protein C8Q71DRAFT_791987 [Rhodofomes roseus]